MTGILGAFNIGVTGLSAIGSGLNVIGDNIANAGTTAFKSSRAEFQDVLSKSLKGIMGGDQFGSGTKLGHIRSLYTQGDIMRTENVTDLSINGDGFFVLETPFGRSYTRDGSFHFDKNGYLVNSDEYKILGYKANAKGEITHRLEPIKLSGDTVPAKATNEAYMMMNLDSRANEQVFDAKDPNNTSSFSTSMTIFDNTGAARLLTFYFNKVVDNVWESHVCVEGADALDGEEGEMIEMGRTRLVFNDKGVLQEEVEELNSFNFNNGAALDQKMRFDFGVSLSEGGDGSEGITQYGSDSSVTRFSQNGSSAAKLRSMSFDNRGVLAAIFDNGESENLAQMSVAKFDNNEGLFKLGRNLYKDTRLSGEGNVGKPSDSGRGEVLIKSIELSNVDIATEFVSLMTAQRNFTANAKTLSTVDEMMQEVLNIKR